MTVYVDDMRAQYGRMVMCHMLADTDDELHAMAARIGVARRWHQAPPEHDSHYDIALSRRALAVLAGAVEITWRQAGAMAIRRRATGALGAPGKAEAWLLAEVRARRALPFAPQPQPSIAPGAGGPTCGLLLVLIVTVVVAWSKTS